MSENSNEEKEQKKETENMNYMSEIKDYSGTYYKNMVREINQKSKGDLFTKDDIIAFIRKHYEAL